MTGTISKEELQEGLATRTFGRNLFVFDSIDSTNVLAGTLASTGAPEGTVVWADFQTAGKGRLGRAWQADPGVNLTFSVIVRDLPEQESCWMPYYVAEGVAGGVERSTTVQVSAKWPNDLLLDGRKFAGMLLERVGSQTESAYVAGIGVNVNQTIFPPDIDHSATSLSRETGTPIDRIALFHALLENLEALFLNIRTGHGPAILDAWKDRCVTFGRRVSVTSGSDVVTGHAVGLDTDGGLILRTDDGHTTVHAGDVSLRTND